MELKGGSIPSVLREGKEVIGMKFVRVERTIPVSADRIWSAISDFHRPPCHDMRMSVIKEGDPEHGGEGLERTLVMSHVKCLERIESVAARHQLTYQLFNPLLREYHGRAELIPHGNQTEIHWSGDFEPKLPLTGKLLERVARKNINMIIDELEQLQ